MGLPGTRPAQHGRAWGGTLRRLRGTELLHLRHCVLTRVPSAPRRPALGVDRMSNGSPQSPLRANGQRTNGRGPKRIDLAALEQEETGTTLTGKLILSAGNPGSSLSNGGPKLMQGGFKKARTSANGLSAADQNSGPGGQRNLLPAAMQKPSVPSVIMLVHERLENTAPQVGPG